MPETHFPFLKSLARDSAANVLAIAAAAMIPLLLIVGSVIDLSRYHMVTTRLQNACDSGAIAARKAMQIDTFSEANRAQGLAFFDNNYHDEAFGLTDLERDYVATSDGIVSGSASGTLPTSMMSMFGYDSFEVAVSCSAEINISNTDIVFVLDVTGSMNCPDDGSYCPNGNYNNTEASNAKIRGLRTAVMSFYDVVDEATSPAAQVRFGVVPYSSGINVGRAIPAQYMATEAAYQTRVPQWITNTASTLISFHVDAVSNRAADSFWYYWYNPTGQTGVTNEATCQSRAASSTLGFTDSYIDNSIQNNTIVVVSESTVGTVRTRVITARAQFSKAVPVAWWSSRYSPPCFTDLNYYKYNADLRATIVENVTGTPVFDRWRYQQHTWDLTGMYSTGAVALPTGASGTSQTHSWDGCIEEAGTTTASTFDPLPTAAYDLDINLVPTSNDQRWRPTLPGAVYMRHSGGNRTTAELLTAGNQNHPPYYCPKAATRLAEMDRSTLSNYLLASNGFLAVGSTYHDIGMIWGGRFISPNGIFADDNDNAPNGDAIGRHIVFMTDGELSTNDDVYTPYRMHWWDRRVSSSTDYNTMQARHAARFQAACRQARAENISVWVVAFGTGLSQNLIDCATPGRSYHASDSEELQAAFEEIAEKIASLRLTG
jgi:Flp pilus assembly protein TadG